MFTAMNTFQRLAAMAAILATFAVALPAVGSVDASAASFKLKPNEKRFAYSSTSASFDVSTKGVKRINTWLDANPSSIAFIGAMSAVACAPVPGAMMKAACIAALAAAAPVMRDRIQAAAKAKKCFGIAGGLTRDSWRAGAFGPAGKVGCQKTW